MCGIIGIDDRESEYNEGRKTVRGSWEITITRPGWNKPNVIQADTIKRLPLFAQGWAKLAGVGCKLKMSHPETGCGVTVEVEVLQAEQEAQ